MSMKDWTLVRKIKNGHAYWRRKNDGAIGIADDSGTYPENCEPADSPPLLLDRTRPVVIGREGNYVPLTTSTGRLSRTPVTGFEALWVAAQFCVEVEAQETLGSVPWRFAMLDVATVDAHGKGLRDLWMADVIHDKLKT